MEQGIDLILRFLGDFAVRADAVEQNLAAEVRGQNDDRVLKVYGPALRVRDPAVVEDLKQDVEYIRMCLFNFVKQNDGIRTATHSLGQLTAFLIAHVSGRRANETRHGELLHVLRHVDPNEVLLVVKQARGQRLGQLRFANARGAKEQKRAKRPVRILNTGSTSLDGLGDDAYRFVLPDDSLVERVFEVQKLFAFGFHESRNGNARPALNDLRDFFLCDLIAE